MEKKGMTEDLKYIMTDTDRHGNVRHYYRRFGRKVRLKGDPGSLEFHQNYLEAGVSIADIPIVKRPELTNEVRHFVYFILFGNSKVKIGVCTDAGTRFKSLKTGIPGKATIYYVTPGSYSLERHLHRLFAEDRISGEWFYYSKVVRDWIDADDARRRKERGVETADTISRRRTKSAQNQKFIAPLSLPRLRGSEKLH